METVFVSNYYNHHQASFSEDMYRLTGGNYRFIATESMDKERLDMGWGGNIAPFVMHYHRDKASCKELIDNSDVVIIGSAPEELLTTRIANSKMVFRYSERIYKKFSYIDILKLPVRCWRFRKRFNHKNMYMLCASAYTAKDYALTGNFLGKTYKWGYFPETKKYDIDELIGGKKPASLLWVARFIDWKHPELPVQVAKRLKSEGYQFELNMIGNGVMEEAIRRLIEEQGLSDFVHMLGAMKPEQVRERMEKSQIFLFTSDRNEGWGAVLNEAMNSGCAVVASHAIGSVPFLLEHEKNGLIYRDGDFESLYSSVKQLLDDAELCKELGREAYSTITELWNAEVAAQRLLVLIDELNKRGTCDVFDSGPCSRAPIIKDGWFKDNDFNREASR